MQTDGPSGEKKGTISKFRYHHSEVRPTSRKIKVEELSKVKSVPDGVRAEHVVAWNGDRSDPSFLVTFQGLPFTACKWLAAWEMAEDLTQTEIDKLPALLTPHEKDAMFKSLANMEKYSAPVQQGKGDRAAARVNKKFKESVEERE